VPVTIVRIVDGHFDALTGGIGVLFEGEAVVLVEHGLTEFAAVRLGYLYLPGGHGDFREE
jgi:hypothetical protein